MAKTPVRDVVIWLCHLHGDASLATRVASLRGGETIDLLVDGVRGTWRKMSDGKDGRGTNGIRPVGAAQGFWKQLYATRRGEMIDLDLAQPETVSRAVIEPAPGSMQDRLAALERFLEFGRQGYSSDGRTMTRDEMHER